MASIPNRSASQRRSSLRNSVSSSPILDRFFSSALVGATVGAASFGPLADRFGRKTLLIVAVLLIGGFTILTVFANSVPC
jgi:Sugar (and other) transporter.